MCEKCDEQERIKKISCALCSTGTFKPTDIEELNHEVEEPNLKLAKIEAEMEKQHKEAIAGYDKQINDCLGNLANFSTKMLIMFEDYKKKGDQKGMIRLLESIRNYAVISQTDSSVLVNTCSMLITKMQGSPQLS
jgi:hypothetical protein